MLKVLLHYFTKKKRVCGIMKLRGPIKDTKTFATAFLLYVILLQKLVDKILRNKIHQSEVKKIK